MYISFSDDISDPESWTNPLRILDASGWYPQVVGLDKARQETDSQAGQVARLFVAGKSSHLIRFALA